MLIIDKKNDVVTLRNLGANDKQITRVFLFEGRMIAVIGAVIGIGLGLLLCLATAAVWFRKSGRLRRLVYRRCLSGKRSLYRCSHHLRYGYRRRLACRMVSGKSIE